MIEIHLDDTRRHQFPEGWHPMDEDQPKYVGDSEVWFLTDER